MSDPIHMVQITLDARRLTKWAIDRRLDAGDIGYTSHALMADAFGDLYPHPFSAEEKMGRVKVLGYVSTDAEAIKKTMEETAEPEVASCVLDVVSKKMPGTWAVGQRLRFKLRIAPTRQGHHTDGIRMEKDALAFEEPGADRQETYLKWLTARLNEVATVENCDLTAFSYLKACRRATVNSGKRPAKWVMLPDAMMEGTLKILSVEGFENVLRSGIGRHKAFGFGALMLRPPQAA